MAEKKPFEKIFPYFSYRWRYEDGQYSPYAVFTKAQFVSKDPNISDYLKKGHNTSVVNELKVINLTNIPRGGPDVVAIDILYRESISTTIYILKTIEISKNDRGSGFESIQIDKRSFGSALPDSQLSRHFDNVPLKAKAQEITANRLMYGNYTHKYDIPEPLRIKVNVTPVLQPHNGPSVKTNRDYEVGVAYLDAYGRVGNLLTQSISGPDGEGSVFTTDFKYKNRINLTAQILSPPPTWAKSFRYYVKDKSNAHFNLTGFNIYNDGSASDNSSDNVYVQFNSNDRNKITEESILIPRRHDFDETDVLFTAESRHPVLDIENEAPDIVINQVNERKLVKISEFKDVKSGSGTSMLIHSSYSNINVATVTTSNTFFHLKDRSGETHDSQGNVQFFNDYIRSQDDNPAQLFDSKKTPINNVGGLQTVDISAYPERLAIELSNNNGTSDRCLIDSIEYGVASSSQRNSFKITLGTTLDESGALTSTTGFTTVPSSFKMDTYDQSIRFFKFGISDDGKDKLKGSFFVKIPREVANNTGITALPTGQTPYNEDGNIITTNIKQINFETEPVDESNLNLYWEDGNTRPISKHNNINHLEWSNCIATKTSKTGDVYLESINLLDKFNTVSMAKGTRVNTPDTRYAKETRKAGLIFSGLYNSKTGINELNQFSLADGIQKELEPNYGGIQKLYTLDTNLLAFAEDKVFRILADKDALFNADDGVNVTATNLVLGQAMVYQGNYGISTHPESLIYFNNQLYFTDAKRGAVMQLTPSNGQLFPISSRGMSNFFRDRLHSADELIGMYDGHKKQYVLSIKGYDQNDLSIGSESIPNETSDITIAYSPRSESWPSRYSFIPESGLSMNNKFYTFKQGKAYVHHNDSVNRNTFYGTAYNSEVELIFNDDPMAVKEFLALSYEGTTGWSVSKIDTESNDPALTATWPFVKKEDKYFAPIVSQENYYGVTDQSLGSATADDGSTVYIQGTKDKSGIKGFYNKVRMQNTATAKAEIFAINTENFISQT